MIRDAIRAASFGALGAMLAAASLEAQELARSAAIANLDALRIQQCQVQAAVRTMPGNVGPERDAVIQELRDTKNHMYAELTALETLLDSTPALQRAAAAIRESRLKEKIEYSRGTVEHWDDGSENTLESVIQDDLGTIRSELPPAPGPLECPTSA